MSEFQTRIQPDSPDFRNNRRDMLALVAKMRAIEGRAEALSERRRPVFDKRGQLSPRERLAALLDPGMPFLELYNMAGFLVDDPDPKTSVPGASMIVGIGFVCGTRCLVFVDDAGINAGAATAKSVDKALGALAIALRQKLPFVHCVESAGASLMAYTVELWAHGDGMFAGLARLSAAGIPVITVLHGASTAGGAYQPGLSDYVIGIKGNGMAMLAGAALLHAATGELAEDQTLGGAQMHAQTTGPVEYLANDDRQGIEIAREVVAGLDWNSQVVPRPTRSFSAPALATDDLAGIVPSDYRKPHDIHEVAARLVDSSELRDFKPDYGPSTLCLQARIFGVSVGIIGNNGPIDPDAATKCAHFLQLCDQAQTPVIFLNNTTGYMVGADYEHAGMIKHGAKMIQAVTNFRAVKLSIYIGASFGAGNYGMCGYAFQPDFLFTWPNAMTGVMGAEQAAGTMEQVISNAAERRGAPPDPAKMARQRQQIITHFNRQSDAFYTSGRLLDHGMIDPRDTRRVIAFCLETCHEARARSPKPNTYGVARAAAYVGAGTVEFLLDQAGAYYFLEMNTRLQVEHPLTEIVCGIDLVEWQFSVAQGRPLALAQTDIRVSGHAIEARLYAEDPAEGFLPSAGQITCWQPPSGNGVRVDSGIVEGQPVLSFYDPLLAKIIASGPTREIAQQRLAAALGRTVLFGPATNRDFLHQIVCHPRWRAGAVSTAFIATAFNADALSRPLEFNDIALAAGLLFEALQARAQKAAIGVADALLGWGSPGFLNSTICLSYRGTAYDLDISTGPDGSLLIKSASHKASFSRLDGSLRLNGQRVDLQRFIYDGHRIHVATSRRIFALARRRARQTGIKHGDPNLRAPMHGTLMQMLISPGDKVTAGTCLARLEAMKMQHDLCATSDGTVAAVLVKAGAQVKAGDLLVEIRKES